MANDRLWIECRHCGEKLLLAKFWGDRFETPVAPTEDLASFLNDHWLCPLNVTQRLTDRFDLCDESSLKE
jgi:hypothetical protein